MNHSWRLDDARQTLVLISHDNRLAEIIYWGKRLPDDENLETLYAARMIDLTGGALDAVPELSICPQTSRSFPGQPGMHVQDMEGNHILPAFQFKQDKASVNGISLIFEDTANGLEYEAHFAIDDRTHIITAQAYLCASRPVHIHWLSAPVFPAPQLSDEMIDFSGRWCGEFQTNNSPWLPGIRFRENRTGRTGHEHFPGLVIPCKGTTNTQGKAYAFHYGWSGGHRMVAEELADGRRQIQFGNSAHTEPVARSRFETATLFATYSDKGINGCAIAFQRHVRDRIVQWPDHQKQRPVHYNCWEAIYFDHDLEALKDIADKAASLGAERFVLDDGWFTNRRDDTRALGDWKVDTAKYPDGLKPLINHVEAAGMTFGLWFEPEMVSRNSEIFKSHPDWILGSEDQIPGRNQLVLNMALPEVRNYLFDLVSEMLTENRIEYIKWDHNRVLPFPDADQTRATYSLIDRIRTAFPHVEIESCASGGGRIDFGILERTHRVWLSDSNDAQERLRSQHNASLFLPMAVTGSHVGPRTSHTSGRTHDIGFRAWVAAQRHLGFEMDPRELSDHEANELREVVAWWKANRDWLCSADIHRLDSGDNSVIAEQQSTPDGRRFVLFVGAVSASTQTVPRPVQLSCLNSHAYYKLSLRNRAEITALSRGNTLISQQEMVVSGQYLMDHGVTLPWQFPERIWVVEGTRI